MIDWTRATVLTGTEFDVVRDLLGLGPNPAVLDLLAPGTTDLERARVVRAATASAAARGLVVDGVPVPQLADDIRTLTTPDFRFDLVVAPPYRQRALVGLRAGRAVLAARIDDDVALLRLRPADAPATLVGLLGDVVPGPGPTVRIPVEVLAGAVDAAGDDADRFVRELLRRGCTDAEADLVRRMGRVDGMAQLGAGRGGADPCRAPAVLLVHVTAQGCYYQRRPAPDMPGRPLPQGATVHAGPADVTVLAGELERLADAARRRRTPVGARRAW
ncbi:EspG family protein [Pseudonocardia ammonioxydans]|uniref:EspG family protein n=1 Tax=Pseudonocardia ammonioxydans TaxID=260086 RepID=A0A1I4X7A2_PSUAM|nr:ESX secretion-associated protein EspG [Pseudonocardia ammonioxydans]SFN21582.1 EspG family protein [Pseudonocardia ammonioxydans]